MSRVVLISKQADTISNGDQCLCLIRYLINFSDVSLFIWFDGFETLAQNAMSSCTSVKAVPSGAVEYDISFTCVKMVHPRLCHLPPVPISQKNCI